MKNKNLLLTIILFYCSGLLFGQSEENTEFIFQDGIYTSYKEFKNNNPSKKYEPIVLSPGEVSKYLAEHPSNVIISSTGQYIWVGHFTTDGEFVRIPPDSIWGFSKDNKVVLKYNEYLVNLTTIGSICYFSTKDAFFAEMSKNTDDNQYIFEFADGKVKRFKRDVILSILSNDMELYQQFLAQDSYKKMKESMFEYVLKYNKRNPISLPE